MPIEICVTSCPVREAGSDSSTAIALAIPLWFLKAVLSLAVAFSAVDALPGGGHTSRVTKDVVQIVGSTIRRMREERGISQEEFAQVAGLDRSFYGRVERGTQNIAQRTLCVLAASLEVHPAELLRDIAEADCNSLKVSSR